MPDKKQIAFYIDVDNCDIKYDNFIHAIANLQEMGEIIIAKVYGVSERKNKDIYGEIARRGFEVAPPARSKKRGKFFDGRMVVDIMEDVLQNTNIDAVAIVAPPADMVYFYRRLLSYNVDIIALDNNDEEASGLVDRFLDIGLIETIKPIPKKKTAKRNGEAAKTETESAVSYEKPKADENQPAPETETVKEETSAQSFEEPKLEKQSKTEEELISEEKDDLRQSQIKSETEINSVAESNAETSENKIENSQPAEESNPDNSDRTFAAAETDGNARRSVADWQLAGEIDSMLEKIVVPDKDKLINKNTVNPDSPEPILNEKKDEPASGGEVPDGISELQDEAASVDDENAELLEEIKKLLEEFKSE